MYLDIVYSKATYLGKPKRLIIWNGRSIALLERVVGIPSNAHFGLVVEEVEHSTLTHSKCSN